MTNQVPAIPLTQRRGFQLKYKGLRFPQTDENMMEQHEAAANNQPGPSALFTFFGGLVLSEEDVRYMVDQMEKMGQIRAPTQALL